MTVLFRANLQNTLTPEVGTFDNTSNKTGSFGIDGGEYYLQNSNNTYGYYFYYLAPGSDNSKLTITFDIALINSSSSGWSVLFSGSDDNWWGLFTSGNTFSLNTRSGGDTNLGSYSTATWYTVKITQEVSLGVLKIKLYIDDVEKASIDRATSYAITDILLLGNTSTNWTAYGTVLKNILITDGEEGGGEVEPTPSGILKYLNYTGLSNLVSNIKNWVTARIPTKTSEITNDSGFITGTSGCVHTTGNEYIEGEKTFASPIQCPYFELTHTVPYIDFHFNYSSADFTSRIAEYTSGELWINGTFFNIDGSVRHTGLVQGVGKKEYASPADLNDAIYNLETTYWGPDSTNRPSSSSYGTLLTLNREGNVHTSTGNGWLVQLGIGTDTRLYLRNKANTSNPWSDWKELITTGSLANYVTLNTQQNISANKFFYGGAWRVGSNYPSFICKNNTHTVGEAAPSSMWGYGEFLIQDKNDYSVGLLSCRYDQNATQYFRIESRNKFTNGAPNVNGTAASSVLDVGTLSNGTPYVYWNSYISNGLVPRLAYAWNIGDANHPWNTVYASNYKIKSANTKIGVTTSNSTVDFIDLVDADNTQIGYIGRWQHNNGCSCITLTCYDKYDGAGNRSTSGTVANGTLEIGVFNTGVPYLNYNTYFMQNISPFTNDDKDLGDASHHWRNLFIGEVHCYHQNAIVMKQGSYTFLLRNDGSYLWFLISAANGNEGTWNDLRPLYINCADGSCSTTSRWSFNKSFGDSDPSILIQSGTAYANGTWNYPLSALAPNMQAGSNLFMPIGRSHSTGNCAGWHFYYAGNNSNDNFLSVEFYAVGSPLSVYRDGRVFLSATPATSDNSTRVATTAYVKNQGYLSGTVPIANGGTGSTTRLGAVQNLTNEHVGTSTQYFLTITQNWGKAGYCSVADAKTVLGIGTTSKKLTLIGERETEGTWTLTCTTLAPIYFKIVASKTSSSAEFVCGLSSTSSCRFVTDSNSYNSTQIVYTVVRTGSSGEAMWGIGIPTSSSSSVTVFIRNSQYMQTFNIKAYQ